MNREEIVDPMAINNEIGILSNARKEEFLSHSSENPECYFAKTDNAFTKKARLLQAVRRFQSGAACGSFARKGVTYYHPNLCEDGQNTGCNFLDQEIFEYAKDRIANKKSYETIQKDRLFNNFLSSQPMAFNLFYPLMKIVKSNEGQKRLAGIISTLLGSSKDWNIERVYDVGIEFIPNYYKDCLNDKTAMDAYFRYNTTDGKKGIIAIETKYTDILGNNQASNPIPAIKTATERDGITQLFTTTAKNEICRGEKKLSQVFRNFLLTETVRLHEHLYDSASIVIAPKENKSNTEDEEQLLKSLKEEYKYKFHVINLETFVESLIKGFPEEPIFQRFSHRYLDFRTVEWLLKSNILAL